MGKTTELRSEIKRTFVPFAVSRGFAFDQIRAPLFFTFRRLAAEDVQIVEIQWEKYGRPRFALNFGTCPRSGLTIRDKHFPVEQVLAGWLSGGGRLWPGKSRSTRGWFRQDKPILQRLLSSEGLYAPSYVVTQLTERFAQVERYWEAGTVGPQLTIWPPRKKA